MPRRFVLVAVPLAAVLTALHRYVLRRWLVRQRTYGEALQRTLVVGSPSAVDEVVGDLMKVPHHGYDVVGACLPSVMADVPLSAGVQVVGMLSDVPQSVIDHEVDVVIVAGSGLSNASLRRLSWALERTGADLVVAPGLVEVAGPRLRVRPAAGLSLLHVEAPEAHQGRMIGKALLDRSLGLALFLGSLLVVVPAAIAVVVTSRGPAFFRQQRIGRDGVPFTMWKPALDGGRRRGAPHRRPARRQRPRRPHVQDEARSADHAGRRRAAAVLDRRACPTCGTSSAATCRSSARVRRCPPRSPSTTTPCTAGCGSSPA
ncbi:hypothetical protein GCM10025868_14870 [Angustibacter aerolatus]|uniref:Bacterial sugar transferase domain-containing protein n=1 Tax=Angustibacter aerolatus TaxID=1162965 RepID=A0ABQ6JH62_9ACTN|nr:hypothetical protein GCM10025868_14870 [Angustibacter aerolatus]